MQTYFCRVRYRTSKTISNSSLRATVLAYRGTGWLKQIYLLNVFLLGTIFFFSTTLYRFGISFYHGATFFSRKRNHELQDTERVQEKSQQLLDHFRKADRKNIQGAYLKVPFLYIAFLVTWRSASKVWSSHFSTTNWSLFNRKSHPMRNLPRIKSYYWILYKTFVKISTFLIY